MESTKVHFQNYTSLLEDYKEAGNSLYWTMEDGVYIRIKNMDDEYLNHALKTLNIKRKHISGTRSAWIYIFEDVLMKRRINKINKIKKNILNNGI